MIKTIIIEDEINVREALKKILKIVAPNLKIIAETGYVSDAIILINKHKPALVFMDIELEDGTGFDILKKINNYNIKLIFTTAYNQHAIKAFKYSATDYLLKPIDPIELQNAIARVLESINKEKEHEELLAVLQHNIEKKEPKIILKTTEQRYIILIKDIIRLEADGAYTMFIFENKKLIVSKNIKYYQELLDTNFIRTHQSHLINSKHIIGIINKEKVKLSNNELVPIATRKKSEIIELIENL